MRASLTLAAVLLLAACRQDAPPAPQPTDTGATAPGTAEANSEAGAAVEAPELELESLLGVWRVTGVVPDPGATFAPDDPRVVGALMDVYPEKLSWSYQPSADFAPSDLCLGPVAGLIANAEVAGETRAMLTQAIGRSNKGGGGVSAPHAWLCGDGGSWGNEAEFQTVGEERMAMRWPGDITLVLERIRRTSSEPPDLPPTGAFEDR